MILQNETTKCTMGEIWQSLSTHPHCVKITANRLLVLPEKPLDRLSVLFLSTTEHAESKPWFLGSLSRSACSSETKDWGCCLKCAIFTQTLEQIHQLWLSAFLCSWHPFWSLVYVLAALVTDETCLCRCCPIPLRKRTNSKGSKSNV